MNQNTVTREECEAILAKPSWYICTKCGWHGSVKPERHGFDTPNCPYEPIETSHLEKRLARAHLELLVKLAQKQSAFDDLVQGTAAMLDAQTAERDELRSQKAALESKVEEHRERHEHWAAQYSIVKVEKAALESRLDVMTKLAVEHKEISEALESQLAEAQLKLNTPEIVDFMAGVPMEAAHQRERWGSDHDAGKTAADWFWLVGYLAGKALHASTQGREEKALHHLITTAAALANWHSAILGKTNMRPRIMPPDDVAGALRAKPEAWKPSDPVWPPK